MDARAAILFLLLASLLPAPLAAQSIAGLVTDAAGTALSGTTILVTDARDSVRAVILSGPDGRFRVRSEPDDTIRIRAERLGYEPMRSQPLVLAANSELELELRLRDAPVVLEELTVRGERQSRSRAAFERRSRGEPWGRFADAERLSRIRSPRTVDRLRPIIPGMVVGPDGVLRVRKRGADLTGVPTCQPRYYIDGVRYPGDISLDNLVQGDLLRAVEYYPDPQQAPAQFTIGFDQMVFTGVNLDGQVQAASGLSRPCAVIVIWTVHSFGWDRD